MKKSFLILSAITVMAVMLFSCKKDSDGGGGGSSITALTITLSTTSVNLSYLDTVKITVKDQNGNDVTLTTDVTVNNQPYYSNKYLATTVGSFNFIAKKGTVTSNTETLTVTDVVRPNDSLFVSLSNSTIELNDYDETKITVTDMNGLDVTNKCELKVAGNTTYSQYYSPISIGTFAVTAKKGSIPCKTATLNVIAKQPSPFTQKILVEDATGSWCGFCTRGAYLLENYKSTHPNCIVTAIHGGSQPDNYKYQYYTNYNSRYGVTGYPTVIVNRNSKWSELDADLNTALAAWAPLGLAVESSISGGTITGKAKVKFNVTTSKKLKLVVAMVENGLLSSQTNYYSPSGGYTPYLYGGANPINNFVNNGVMRKAATDLFGDAIPVASQTKNNIYEFPFTLTNTGTTGTGSSYTAIPANCTIVAFVVEETSGVLNVQSANAGTTKNFD